MKRYLVLIGASALLCFVTFAQGQETKKTEGKVGTTKEAPVVDSNAASAISTETTESKYVPVDKYDPTRDADKDIEDALVEAKRANKRVLLEVGGLWCIWCRHMDDFFSKQAEALRLRETNFVTVKINYSDENKNADLLSRYPKVAGFPHLFVLDSSGALIQSQDTAELEEGKGYSVEKFSTFLKYWATAPAKTARR